MTILSSLRELFFGAPDKRLKKNENRGGTTLTSSSVMPAESPSKEEASPDEGLLACRESGNDKQEEEPSMKNQLPWDIYESAMLMEAYQKIEQNKLQRYGILRGLSAELRARAVKKGVKIDAVFRNVNGLNLQYERFRYMMTDGKWGFRGPIPKCFLEIKAMYEKDFSAYEKILREAKGVEEADTQPPVVKEEAAPAVVEEEQRRVWEKAIKSIPPSPRLLWDMWEWALLLEAHEKIVETPESKDQILQQLSDILRKRARNNGFDINSTFRDLNVVNLCYEKIRHFMIAGKEGPAGAELRGFNEVRDIYYKDKDWFERLLRKAKKDAGINVPKREKKTAPITVVNGVVVHTSTPRVKEISLKGVPMMNLYRNIYALRLSFDLESKLYRQKIHTMQELAGYLNAGEGEDLSSSERDEIYSKLEKYLNEHRSRGSVDFFAGLKEEKDDKPIAASKPVSTVDAPRKETSSSVSSDGSAKSSKDAGRESFSLSPVPQERSLFAEPSASYGNPSAASDSPVGKSSDNQETTQQPAEETLLSLQPEKVTVHLEEAMEMAKKNQFPMGFCLQGRKFQVKGWKNCYIAALRYLCRRYRGAFENLRVKSIYIDKDNMLVDGSHSTRLNNPVRIENGFYVKSDVTPTDMLTYLQKVRDFCQIKHNAFTLYFYEKQAENPAGGVDSLADVKEIDRASEEPKAVLARISYDLSREKVPEGEPCSISYFGEKENVSGWEEAYTRCCTLLYEDYPQVFDDVADQSRRAGAILYLARIEYRKYMKRWAGIGKDFYLNLGLPRQQMWTLLRHLLDTCRVDYENLVMEFETDLTAAAAVNEPRKEDTALSEKTAIVIQAVQPSPEETVVIYPEEAAKSSAEELPEEKEPLPEDPAAEEPLLPGLTAPPSKEENEPPQGSPASNSLEARISAVLAKRFSDGFVPKRLSVKRFQTSFAETYGAPISMEWQDVIEKIRQVGETRDDGRIYAKAGTDQKKILQDVADALVALLDGGATAVDRECFYGKYRAELAKLSILTPGVMEGVLAKILPPGYRCYYGTYHGKSARAEGAEIVDFIHASPCPVPDADILSRFWYLPEKKINALLRPQKEILNIKSTRFWYQNLAMTDEERARLRESLYQAIWDKVYLTEDDILSLLRQDFPSIAADIAAFPPAVVRGSLASLYPDDFFIVGGNLTDADHQGSADDALRALCRKHTKLTTGDIAILRNKMNYKGNYGSAVMEEMVRVDLDYWVRRDQVHFTNAIPIQIGKVMGRRECIPLREISSFLTYPPVGVKWNLYVLESYLYKNDGICPFCLLQASGGVSTTGAYGVIAKRGSRITDYKAAVIYLLARDATWSNEKEALDRIVAMGLQSERRMKGIGTIVKAAKAERIRLK